MLSSLSMNRFSTSYSEICAICSFPSPTCVFRNVPVIVQTEERGGASGRRPEPPSTFLVASSHGRQHVSRISDALTIYSLLTVSPARMVERRMGLLPFFHFGTFDHPVLIFLVPLKIIFASADTCIW